MRYGISSNRCERILDFKIGVLRDPNAKRNSVNLEGARSTPAQDKEEEDQE